jgi:WD40 repeat protein
MKHGASIRSLAFSSAGKRLFTVNHDKYARIWDIASGRELFRLPSENPGVQAITLDPKGRYLAAITQSNSYPSYVWVWEVASGKAVWQTKFERQSVNGIAFSADGNYLATASWGDDPDAPSRVWSIPQGQEVYRMFHDSWGYGTAFSPNGKYLAIGGKDSVWVWDLSRSEGQTRMLAGDEAAVIRPGGEVIAVSPDSKYLATASWDQTARVWEMATGKEIARMAHRETVTDVAFSPDGQYLVSADMDDTAKLWRLWPKDLMAEACHNLERNLTPEEWRKFIGDEPYRKTCENLP